MIKTIDGEIHYEMRCGERILISSYHYSDMASYVVSAQKDVFDRFGIRLNQFVGEMTHSEALDNIVKIDSDHYIFFDIDSIPLKPGVIDLAYANIVTREMLYGIEQCCNSRGNTNSYVGPAFLCFSKKLYDDLGRPSLKETPKLDVGQNLTEVCLDKGKEVKFLRVTSSLNYKWHFKDGRKFGNGTNYEDLIYHQFQIREPSQRDLFVTYCYEMMKEGQHDDPYMP